MSMTNDISVGSVVFHRRGHIKGAGTVVGKNKDEGFLMYEVVWQSMDAPSGKFEHCRQHLLSLAEKNSLAESNA
jgi:hypothetical protein